MHPIYSLKKIFVEKDLKYLNLYLPEKDNNHHLLKLPTTIDSALRR